MIGIDRGSEPTALTQARRTRLARLLTGALPPDSSALTGYDEAGVRTALLTAQNYRCVYCERDIESGDIEHFRPRSEAARSAPWSTTSVGYWWLTWTWENLWVACGPCNRTKSVRFPIHGSPLQPPADEAALTRAPVLSQGSEIGMIDPGVTDPLDALQWEPQAPTPADRKRWTWLPVAWPPNAPQVSGTLLLQVLPLDTTALVVTVSNFLRTSALDAYNGVRASPAPTARWQQLEAELQAGERCYPSAFWCALEYWRDLDGLAVPKMKRPGRRSNSATLPSLPKAPPGVTWPAWLDLLQGDPSSTLIELCTASPRTKQDLKDELEAALGVPARGVDRALAEARRTGQLKLSGGRWTP